MLSRNIVLIGMPGSGKTTIGKMLSERLKVKFIDTDDYIEDVAKQSIPEIFKHGEEYFRKLERQAVSELSIEKSVIISTGGGAVKNYLNIKDLKKNGIIIFIDRPIKNIVQDVNISNRPLLKQGPGKLYDIFDERYELYKKYCDFWIINDEKIEDIVQKILKIII